MAITLRWSALLLSAIPTAYCGWLFVLVASADGWTGLDSARLILSSLCVFWLSWGAATALIGLVTPAPAARPEVGGGKQRTAILMPIYNEDPPSTFARVAAVSTRLAAIGAHDGFDLFILSDSQSLNSAAREALWFERLLTDCPHREQIFYRRRPKNVGRKAGNIEDFIRHSGAAYEYAIVLDADSLMDAETIVTMVRRMDAVPNLGLLQTLPKIVHGHSLFGRALQFATHVYTPVYAEGTALLQGREGPYWGHNAIFRVGAFAQSCGLPELTGRPPFGGNVLSHDYVEAALLARAGYDVRLDPDLGGSFEEGPDNILDFAKRDQRWCQGNLQHSRVLVAPALRVWNRITLLQGICSYLMSPVWLVLLIVSIAAADLSRPEWDKLGGPDWAAWALMGIVAGVLIVPKLLIALRHAALHHALRPAQAFRLLISVLAEIVLSSLVAPIVLMFQIRAVIRVLSGFDGGWPASNRTDGLLSVSQAWSSSWWITCCGGTGLAVVAAAGRGLTAWSLPVALPMLIAPLIIAATSRRIPALGWLWSVSAEAAPSPVMRDWQIIYDNWTGPQHAPIDGEFSSKGTADVLG